MSAETLPVGDLLFEVQRSSRRKTLGLTVDRAGELKLYAPETVPREQLEKWVKSRLLWVYQKLAIKEASLPLPRPAGYVSGDAIYYLGRSYRVRFVANTAGPVHCRAGWLELSASENAEAPARIREWFQTTGGHWLKERVKLLSERYGLVPSAVEVLDLGNRWGSCSATGRLNFNWRLLQFPIRLIDYVITHELVHLKVPHHNDDYWRRLEALMPDYPDRKAKLLEATREYDRV
ncbi:putative metal-dependent hydrolase [Burkholderia pseudomallei]|uniref:M48 family metallopeptidase n=1 Tax=Burkholderia pseudomallei TaxID=28450 RepID=UPI0021F7EBA6|nr:SprT family zinc-dependent metalloprotease [Burkholderia pseudomallei]MCW0080593.1 M48 family metallopeptidase [Burkholderia pseudomallei]CAJ8147017.1 putative metal-dependent hydrolase [Burkholderia pseudomallei]CAJ8195644.1 putative metal-dependent hydrolase [Burkholderia pseudomallei]CAJ8935741.1 putative metal-dependent hydrolase [Burkholderia pseudomallei]